MLPIAIFASLVLGLFLGHPLAFALGGVGLAWGLGLWGTQALPIFALRFFSVMNNWVLVAVPLFIFMANILERSGVAENLFEALGVAFSRVRGGLGIAVIFVCTVFAACTGIIGASVVSMGLLAIPTMLKQGYQKELTTGLVAAGGTLGILIPPSIMLVMMGEQSGLSVGQLFMGAIVPGLMLSSLYAGYVLVLCRLKPQVAGFGATERAQGVSAASALLDVLKALLPPMLLILGVLGSIFAGVATATEAAGVGAFLAAVLAIAYRRFSFRMLGEAVRQTAVTSSMSLMIVVGASAFTSVFLGVGGGDVVREVMLGLGLGKWGTFVLMMFFVFILGMFIDWIGIVYITFPIFLPIAAALGFDKLWFVITLAVNLQNSFLTPPFGYALFYLRGIVPEGVTLAHIYRGIIPFVLLMLLGLLICIAFPDIVLWLPGKMIG
jgi:tripartite ATP-independent transporter DctM subunit